MKFPSGFIKYSRYWDEIRGGSFMPMRKSFNPFMLPKHIQRSMILQKKPDASGMEIRLAGSEFIERFGADFTGISYVQYLEHLNAKDCNYIEDELLAILEQPCGIIGCREWEYDGKVYSSHFLHLPFSNTEKVGIQIISLFEYENGVEQYVKHQEHDFGVLTYLYAIDFGSGVPEMLSYMDRISLDDVINSDVLVLSS